MTLYMFVSPQQVLISSIGDVSVLFKRLAFSQHIEARPNKPQACHVLWDSCLKSETYFALDPDQTTYVEACM